MAIIAKGKVRHNGKDYVKGDEIIDLTEKEANRLIDLAVAEAEGKTVFKAEPASDKKDEKSETKSTKDADKE
ncbi:hypothetical protein [Paenibacillus wynnii]|uniref:DUF7210 domain-containing protein n=1 Tax=Paenibacillus wynnii TaxID=268407 RepID=A0A098MF88_9BACL|nr:hypothetical protein [Paenibacillus wynnii]KGE20645.1 hypothetical protein PWYN_00080 [Paenibacillus wynnii]KGE20703.1 hypothetical protein PWYN_00505 [Paenibacillus wynnii]